MVTKPKGIHATFAVDCPRCNGEFTVTNGRFDDHHCTADFIEVFSKALDLDDLTFQAPK